MDRSSYREPLVRGSPAGSVVSSSSQGTKRRRTTYNTPIPIEYRNQFLRTPDTAFSPHSSQNGKSEPSSFGSSTNRTLFGQSSRNTASPTVFPQIPSRQSPGQLHTSPPRASGMQRSMRRPVRSGITPNRSNLSSNGPSRGTSVAGSVDGNPARPSPSLAMLGSSVPRPPGSTKSSIESGSLRGSVSNYTASSYSRPLFSAEELKQRADPLIGFLGKSIQRAKGALSESKEAEKEALRIKEREEIRRNKEEEERRRRDAIFQQIMEEEAEKERKELLGKARALQQTQREEGVASAVQPTLMDSQLITHLREAVSMQTGEEVRPRALGFPAVVAQHQTTKPGSIREVTQQPKPNSPPTVRISDTHNIQPPKYSVESGSDAEDVVVNAKKARAAVMAYNKYQASDEEYLDENIDSEEDELTADVPDTAYGLINKAPSDTEDRDQSSDEEEEDLEYSGEEDNRDANGEVVYEGFENEDELAYSQDEEEEEDEEEEARSSPKKLDNSVIEIIDDDSEEEQRGDNEEQRFGHLRGPSKANSTRRCEKDEDEDEEEQQESYDDEEGATEGSAVGDYDGEEVEDEADEYFSEDEESEEERPEECEAGYICESEEMMDVDAKKDNQTTSAVDIVDLDEDDDMVEVGERDAARSAIELNSGTTPISEHVAAYEDMDISLDFLDTETHPKHGNEFGAHKDVTNNPGKTEAASGLEALGKGYDFPTTDDWEKEITGAPLQKFPHEGHVWRTISDDGQPAESFEEIPTERESELDNEDELDVGAVSAPPSFIDLMIKKNSDPMTRDHPSVPTPTERLKIVDDDADEEDHYDGHIDQDRMEVLDSDNKQIYESEKNGLREEDEVTPTISHSIDLDVVEESGHFLSSGPSGDTNGVQESESVSAYAFSGDSNESEEKSIDDLLAEKQERFSQEMRASDVTGNMEPFIQEEAQMAFVFNRDSPGIAEEEQDHYLSDTDKVVGEDTAPITLNTDSSNVADTQDTGITPTAPKKQASPVFEAEKELAAEPALGLNEETIPKPNTDGDRQMGSTILPNFLHKDTTSTTETEDSAKVEPIALKKEELANDTLPEKRNPTVEEVNEDSATEMLLEKAVRSASDGEDQSREPTECASGGSLHLEPAKEKSTEPTGVFLKATDTSKSDEFVPTSEAQDSSDLRSERSQLHGIGISEEQHALNVDKASAAVQAQPEDKDEELNGYPASGSIYVSGTSTTSAHVSTTHIEYRAVIDEDVPTTVLTVKAFDAEILETTEPTDFQLPSALDFSTPDPCPFEIEEKEDDLESVEMGWRGPDSPMTGTTEIYIREVKEEEHFDVEILRDAEASDFEDESEEFADAKDAEASDNAESSEEYADAEGAKDHVNAEEAGVEETEVFADAAEIERDVNADEAEEFTDASEEPLETEDDKGSVYEDQPDSSDEDEVDPKYSKTAPRNVAQQPLSEDKTRQTSVEPARDKDEGLLSINVQLSKEKPSDSKSTSSTHGDEFEGITPTRNTFSVVIESPTGSKERRASVAFHVEETEQTPSVVVDQHFSPQTKKRKRESEEPDNIAQQKVTKVLSGAISQSGSPTGEVANELGHDQDQGKVEEILEDTQKTAEDDGLEQLQNEIVNDIVSGGEEDGDELPESVNEGMELRDGKVVLAALATSEKSEDPSIDVKADNRQKEGLKMELRDGKVIGSDVESTKSKERNDEDEEDEKDEEDEEDFAKDVLPEHSSPSRGMELRDGKVVTATPSRETSMEPREAPGMSLRRGKVLATPNKRDTRATPSMSPPVPIGVSSGEEILPKSQKGRRTSKTKTPVPATPVRRSTRRVSPVPPAASQVLSPLREAEEVNETEKALEEVVVKPGKSKRMSKKRSVAEVSTDELAPPSVKEATRGGKRAKTVSRGPSIEPEEGGLKSRLRRKV